MRRITAWAVHPLGRVLVGRLSDGSYGAEFYNLPLHCFDALERATIDNPKAAFQFGKALEFTYEIYFQ